ncbi:MAG: PulJ/GspJ family protein [Limisphaerales bacterium]
MKPNRASQNARVRIHSDAVRDGRGFTLIEIMLALAIFTLLMGALYSTWVLVMRATTVGRRTAAQLQRERISMQTLEDSLTFIQSHQASIEYYLFDVQNGDSPILSFVAYLPEDFPRSGEFLSGSVGGPPMDFHLRRVTFSLQADDEGDGKDLVMRQNPFLMDMSAVEQNHPLVLAKNVTDFLIECWDTNTMQWDTEWDATNIIPPLVRVTLAFANPSSGDETHPAQVVTRLISFPSTTMPTAVQTPSGGNFPGGNPANNPAISPPGGAGGAGPITPQSMTMQGQPPDLGQPNLPTGPPSHVP